MIKQNTIVLFADNAKHCWDKPKNTIETNPQNNVIKEIFYRWGRLLPVFVILILRR